MRERLAVLLLGGTALAAAGSAAPFLGSWEYRQSAGTAYDPEGEILELAEREGALHGTYLGLEREGEHGLFYTAVELRELRVSEDGELAFTVPERELFHERPRSLADRAARVPAGHTREELHFTGVVQDGTLRLDCRPVPACPAPVMVFKKGAWEP
jgi:hypothetical protein